MNIKKFVGLPEGYYRVRCRETEPHIYKCETMSSSVFNEKENAFIKDIMIELKDLYELDDYDYAAYIEDHPDKIKKALEETIIDELSRRLDIPAKFLKKEVKVECYVPHIEGGDYIPSRCKVEPYTEGVYMIREIIRTLDDIYEESVDADTRWEFAENLVDKAKEL